MMMIDRELLELAAKAAGMVVLERPWNDDDGWFFCQQHGNPAMHFRKGADPHHYSKAWLPLTDDGDALRLAVKLNMTISMNQAHAEAIWYDEDRSITHSLEQWDNGMEPEEWTRRAIVRAAAEIGKAMP